MIRRARNFLTSGAAYGLLLTAAVLAMQRNGLLENLEHWCYDRRVQYCQFFNPMPTDRLVHLDIDDAVLESIGGWPWPRATLAEMIDEISAAQPRAIAMDILFSDPQKVRWLPRGGGQFTKIDDDKAFAAAVRRAGCVLIGASLKIVPQPPPDPVADAVRAALVEDLERDEKDVDRVLREKGIGGSDLDQQVARDFLRARREAVYRRVRQELERKPCTAEQLRRILLKKSDENQRGVVVHVLDDEYEQALADLSLVRFSRPPPPGLPQLFHVDDQIAPIPALADAASSAAFFDYPAEAGGTVRRVPLFLEHGGRIYPHISIALAAMQVGAHLGEFRFTDDSVIIPRHDGQGDDIVVPVYTIHSQSLHRQVPMMFDIPFFGTDKWETMYEKVGGAHLSLNTVWDICQTRHRIRENSGQADEALRAGYEVSDEGKLAAFNRSPPALDDVETREKLIRALLDDYGQFFDAAKNTGPQELPDDAARQNNAKVAAAGKALTFALKQYPLLRRQLDTQRNILQGRLRGRSVLIGWAATSAVADVPPTPIHAKCPGVVIHGTIFNAMLTGKLWRRAPTWVDGLATAIAGFLATFFASRLTPSRAFVYAVLLAGGYAAFNGLVIFDSGGRIVSLAGPLVAIAVVWAGCTLVRLLVESWERARITRRFSSYVDPSLVKYVAEHPEEVRLEGQVRELTVVFTDLEGFTNLTEQLGEKTVGLLNEFMGMAVPIIRSQKGLVNKFLGDGIMFFFGAPLELPDHAARAIATVLDLQTAMGRLNDTFASRGLPRLGLRAGISTGSMVVGDAGYEDASDYTVLGDYVNLGARLESANKLIGSNCLITDRTVELAGDAFLVRPIGKLCVVGRQAGTMTYEALARAENATPTQIRLAELSREMVNRYMAGQLQACREAIVRLESEFGPSRFTALYREQCEAALRNPSDRAFDCQILLNEK